MREPDGLFLMTNLFPRTTGLLMPIWVGPRYGVAHNIRIKVARAGRTSNRRGEMRGKIDLRDVLHTLLIDPPSVFASASVWRRYLLWLRGRRTCASTTFEIERAERELVRRL